VIVLEEWKQALRELLKEELSPIHQRFEKIDERFEQIDQRFEKIDEQFEQIGQRFENIDEKLEDVNQQFKSIDRQFEGIRTQLDRMEQNQNEDVIGMLKLINGKLERVDDHGHRIELLNERVFRLEADVRQLTRK
jgi:chromosome segregation ATPase